MQLPTIFNKAQELLGENSPTVLTMMGVSGTITTAWLSGRASYRAAQIIEVEQEKILNNPNHPKYQTDPLLSTKEKFKLVWPLYIPAATIGTSTIGCIVGANQLASKKAAALAAAAGISERALQEYKDKVVEKLGETKAIAVRDAIAQDHVDKHPVNTREVILAGTGEVLCFDITSGRYFQSSVEEIKKAENKINFEIVNHMYASLSQFYEEIGLPPTGFSDDVGFNTDNRCEVSFTTTMSSDDRPCIAIDFHYGPVHDYARLWG